MPARQSRTEAEVDGQLANCRQPGNNPESHKLSGQVLVNAVTGHVEFQYGTRSVVLHGIPLHKPQVAKKFQDGISEAHAC